MSITGSIIGLLLTTAMFLFSAYIFARTGDWVAAIFALGSLGYGVFFLTSIRRGRS